MQYKILIVSQSHLCNNPRVLKEAATLARSGFSVTILTAIYSDYLLQQDLELLKQIDVQYKFYSDLRKMNIRSLKDRVFRRVASALQTAFNMNSLYSIGFGPKRLFRTCTQQKADLYIMHQEIATCIGAQMISGGYKVAFDLEDWYSEDLLPEARKKRPLKLLRKAERDALNKGAFCITTSNALAERLATVYACKAPEVLYNVFPIQTKLLEREKQPSSRLKLFWFSQTIGPGRGIEEFINFTKVIETGVELHLLGHIDLTYKSYLMELLSKQHMLIFHKLVPDQELAEKISEFDIGLALELSEPPSRNLTITNKFFKYLQAGLPIIATDTAGQKEGFEKFRPGIMIPQKPTAIDAEILENWLKNRMAIQEAQAAAKEAALYYSWERESEKLDKLVGSQFRKKTA